MWEKCKELQEELVRMRRELHQIPELGGELPKTRAYVEEKLKELGIPFVENKTDSGLIATIKGEKEGKTIVLRADMDALPIQEANEVDYISRHEGCMHACGHDTHMTMLLVKEVISPVCGPNCLSPTLPLFRVISRTFAMLKNAASCQPSVLCGH